jgi:DNA-directed RNA polymerase subunit RPC12/RpoP
MAKLIVGINDLWTTHAHIADKIISHDPKTLTKGSNKEVISKCSACSHEWPATVHNLTSGQGCPACAGRVSDDLWTTDPEVASRIISDDPKTLTRGMSKKVISKCSDCSHEWPATVNNLTKGKGCPNCNASKGEELIAKILEEKGIIFIPQWSAKDCRHKRSLPFDFAVMVEGNMVALIEYQGKQHYQSVEWFGGEKALAETQHRDAIKRTYCQTNNIPLLEVHYEWRETENKVEEELVKFLTSLGL